MYEGTRPETRIMYNNALNYGTLTYSTPATTGFVASNIVNASRTALYIPKNNFRISVLNKTFKYQLAAGAKTTITLTEGNYLGSELATELQTKLGGNFVVEYQTTKKFRIKNTASNFTLYHDEDLASWNAIGFTSGAALLYTANLWYDADRIRSHTEIELYYDLGGSVDCSFFALLGERNKTFGLSPNAVINLRLSNINNINAPAININVPSSIQGAFAFLDGLEPIPTYRYFWLTIIDYENVLDYIPFSQLFIGGYVYWENRTVNNSFSIQYEDRSIRTESVSGALFFERYNKYPYVSGLTLAYLTKQQVQLLQQTWFDVGNSQHMYLSLDSGCMNGDITEFLWYGVFDSAPTIDMEGIFYNASFSFRGD
jgi:hypothetical protein